MSEVLFYHMTETTLEKTLPNLLEKSGGRGWRCVVQCGDEAELKTIDTFLWTCSPTSFLAHSMNEDGTENEQPIWLTTQEHNPNNAQIRFMVCGATPPDLSTYERGVYLFDGHNEASLAHARERWKAEKAAGHDVTYWQQKSGGGWEKKA